MEDGGLHMGQHCAHDSCQRLDFLPFKCVHCNHFYCETHTKFAFHKSCPGLNDNIVVQCPVCQRPIPHATTLASHVEVNNLISDHIDAGCTDPLLEAQSRKRARQCDATVGTAKTRCSASALTNCRDCSGQFCAKHRFYADHACKPHSRAASNPQKNPSSTQHSRAQSTGTLKPSSAAASSNKNNSSTANSANARASSSSSSISHTPTSSKQSPNNSKLPVACPICRKNVDGADTSMSASQVNMVVTRHIDAGCPAPAKKNGLLSFLGLS
ncbi:hypothetical protein HDU80_007341 [Chytriomyces hyalinus]|nr:hypothetical protein HDU80_007341 [Chytriomyces hyalinus]